MGAIRIVEAAEVPWSSVRDMSSVERRAKLTDAELDVPLAIHHAGDDTAPQLIEMRLPPGTELPPSAHPEGEILYVVEGELHLGERALGAGSSAFVPGRTFFSLRSGPTGARFVSFRARRNSALVTQAEAE